MRTVLASISQIPSRTARTYEPIGSDSLKGHPHFHSQPEHDKLVILTQ